MTGPEETVRRTDELDATEAREPLRGGGDLRLAIVVDADQPPGLLANTVAAIGVGLGARNPGLGDVALTDAMGMTIHASADRPVPILQADPAAMRALLAKATSQSSTLPNLTVVAFPAFARSLHGFADYEAMFPERRLADEAIAGIGLCGPTKPVRSLTGAFKLLR